MAGWQRHRRGQAQGRRAERRLRLPRVPRRGPRPRGEDVHGGRLQDQPADVRKPCPDGLAAPDGIYVAGNEPGIGNWVHTLEHGRIEFQYRPGVNKSVVTALESLFNEDVKGSGSGYHTLLMRNNTKMPFQVVAVAWRHYMACATFTPKSIDALRTFREALVDKAPELVP